MKKVFILIAVLLTTMAVLAVPAKPGLTAFVQSDGTMVHIQTLGDEFHHQYATADYLVVERGADGDFYYLSASGITTVRAHDASVRNTAEQAFLAAHKDECTMSALSQARQQAGPNRAGRHGAPRKSTQVPTMDSPRVPILLVQYTDKKMKHTKAQFEAQYNTGLKSVYQYFVDQSNGKYTPQFDLYGIYDLPQTRSFYGSNRSGIDKELGTMIVDAVNKAGDEIDWSLYDNDSDGLADVCIVVYAGVGEAQASYTVRESVWPCQWDLTEAYQYGYSSEGPMLRNGVTIDKFAVFNEIAGSSDSGSTMDGIGTFCHEFSHCLGLPDFYDTNYRYYGMGNWSLMNSGCYNGGAVDGDTPIGYSAYEKNFMGWIDLINPRANKQYTLPVFNNKSLETDQAIKIVSDLNSDEYFILENRKRQGWDLYMPSDGLLITHFTYLADRWVNNSVNDEAIQLATIIPADNSCSDYSEDGDLFPNGTKDSFTDTSTPAAKLNMLANGTLATSAGGAGYLGKPVTEITRNTDGTISLWYMKGYMTKDIPQFTEVTDVTSNSFTARWEAVENVQNYTLQVWDANYQLPTLLVNENFSGCKSEGYSDVSSSLNNLCDVDGWTGSKVFTTNGGLRLGSNVSMGSLSSPSLTLDDNNQVTVKLKVKAYNNDTDVNFTVSCGGQQQQFTAASNQEVNLEVFFNNVEDQQKVTIQTLATSKRLAVSHVEIYAGNAALSTTDITDKQMRVIEGITGNEYTVTDLTPNALYNIKVCATYTDDDTSEWSDIWQVQLGSSVLMGDVNGDGVVDVQDVSVLIDYILGKDLPVFVIAAANVNGDETIDVQDVSGIIDIVLQ